MKPVRIVVLGLAALLSVASATTSSSSQQPPPPPYGGGYSDGCTAACSRYFDCKQMNDPGLRGQCITECQRQQADQSMLQSYAQMDCGQIVALVESGQGWGGQSQPPPGYNQPPPGYNQPPPGYNQPPPGYNQPPQPGYAQQCPSPQNNADPRIFQLLTQSAWCTGSYAGGPYGNQSAQTRVQLGQDGVLRLTNNTQAGTSGSGWGSASQGGSYVQQCWRLSGTQVALMNEHGQWMTVPVQVFQAPNGSMALTASGVQYQQCN